MSCPDVFETRNAGRSPARIPALILAFAALLVLSSCSFGIFHAGGDESTASPVVSPSVDFTGFRVTISGLAASGLGKKTVNPTGLDLAAALYDIACSGPAGASLSASNLAASAFPWNSGTAAQGSWTVSVTAKNAGGIALGGGTASVTVVAGTASVPVTVVPFTGNGTFTLNLDWTAAAAKVPSPSVTATLQPRPSGTPTALTPTLSGSTASWSGSVPSGSYLLTVKILNSGTAVWGTTESVLVFKDRTSVATYVPVAAMVNTPPDLTYSIGAGAVITGSSLVLSSTTLGAEIRYTTDGSIPTTTAGNVYAGAIPLTADVTVNAIAYNSWGSRNDSRSYTISPAIFVSVSSGLDTNPGTQAQPKRTIQAGINQCAGLPAGTEVRVETGTYYESVTMAGVIVYGGYAVGYGSRALGNDTWIEDTSAAAGSGGDPNRAVYFPPAMTGTAVLDGFKIQGSTDAACQYTAGIFVNGASALTITNCEVNGGNGSVEADGIFLYGAAGAGGPIVDNSTVRGTSGGVSGIAVGIKITDCTNGNDTLVTSNTDIRGGSPLATGTAKGISVSASAPRIVTNTYIGGGSAQEAVGMDFDATGAALLVDQNTNVNGVGVAAGPGYAYGVRFLNGALGRLDQNTIRGGENATSIGLLVNGSTPEIENNTITGGGGATTAIGADLRYGADIAVFSNNTITGRDANSGASTGLAVVATAGFSCSPVITGNTIASGGATSNGNSFGMMVTGPGANPTIGGPGVPNTISAQSISGNSTGVRFENSATGLLLENTITGRTGAGGGTYTYGIAIAAAAPDISGATISGGTTTAGNTLAGIYIDNVFGAGPNIHDNASITGGSSVAGGCYGIWITGNASSALIEKNRIFGGTTTMAYGVYVNPNVAAANVVVRNNVIQGSGTSEGVGINVTANAVTLSPRIFNNTIFGDPSASGSGIVLNGSAGSASPDIRNNIIFTLGSGSIGIREYSGTSDPLDLDNNFIYGTFHGYQDSDFSYYDGAGINTGIQPTGVAANNAGNDVCVPGTNDLFAGGTVFPATLAAFLAYDWTLMATAPAVLRTGGLDLTAQGYSDDITGAMRSAPWSMGAYEY